MDDRILADALVKKGTLTEEESKKLLTEAADSRRKVEDLIYYKRILDEAGVAALKSEILKIPYQKIDAAAIPDAVLKLIPQETAETYKIAPLQRQGNLLVVGMIDPTDTRAAETLKFIAKDQGISLGVYIITPTDWEKVLRRYSSYRSEIDSALRSLNLKSVKATQKFVALEEGGVAEEAPIIKIVASTLKNAVSENASDIHIEPQRTRTRIRFRVDGRLQERASLPIELHGSIVSRIKILSDLKIDETRIPQDGRFRTLIFGRDIDFRVATFPTPAGEKVAIRVLDPSVGLKGVGSLGLQDKSADLVMESLKKPYGMILVTGPTGSGKTTTLYSLLQILNNEDSNIVSLEDPVEYFVEGVNQSQVHPEIGYDFASGLREILRQDPDIIMVGEIRDTETAKLAIHAALTGHIVLSTLHTNNAVGVIPRLIDMGADSFLLPSALNLMIAQRLVRRICDNCKTAAPAAKDIQDIIAAEIAKLPADSKAKTEFKPPYKIYTNAGCKVCNGKGVIGRIALFEVFAMTRSLADIVTTDVNENKIYDEAKKQGMITMRQDGILKALRGSVSIEEVLRETESD